MSTVSTVTNEENFVQNNYNLGKIFVQDNRYSKGTLLNNTGAIADFPIGTVLARKSDTGQLVPLDADNSTLGQDIPVGILNREIKQLANAGTLADVSFCEAGDVVESRINFVDGDDSLDTVVNDQRIRDLLKMVGIRMVETNDLSLPDNQ